MPDVDPTPETPVTLGDRLAWWRGELKADLAAQHAALLAAQAAQHTALLAAQAAQHTALLAAQAAQHTALLAALSALGGATGGATEATSAAILGAIGAIDTYPEGWTVRALLAQLNTYIDTEPVANNPPVDILPDPGGCGDAAWFFTWRAAFTDTGVNDTYGGEDCDIYAIIAIDAIPGILEPSHEWVYSLTSGFISNYPNGMVQMCVSWDFGNLPVLQYGRTSGESPTAAANPYCWLVPENPGSRNEEIQAWSATKRYAAWYFAVPAGNPMPAAVYCHVIITYDAVVLN